MSNNDTELVEDVDIEQHDDTHEEKISTHWSEKYNPKSIKDVIGNKGQIKRITNWLKLFEKNKMIQLSNPKKRKKNIKLEKIEEKTTNDNEDNLDIELSDEVDKSCITKNIKKKKNENECSCMIVLGNHGTGKTCTVLSILEDLKYDVQLINLSKMCSLKKINEQVDKITKGKNILKILNEKPKKQNAIVIDGIGSVTSQVEKNFIFTILKHNEKNWDCPIIFISDNKHNKVLNTLKSNTYIVYFDNPTHILLKELLAKVTNNENMAFETLQVVDGIIEHCQKDYRRLLQILQNLKSSYGTKITAKHFDEYCTISKKKDVDVDIFNAVAQLMTSYQGIDECMRLYESEKVIVPLMMHQNFIQYINKFMFNKQKALQLANNIAESIAFGDFMENYIFNGQNWSMQDIHGFYTCVQPSFELCSSGIKKTSYDILIDKEHLCAFPQDLNRTSIKQINKKNITNSNTCLKNFDINDFVNAHMLIKKLIEKDKLKECADLFKGYNVKIENIESILKIDKINDIKPVIPSDSKHKLSKLLKINNI